MPEEELVRSWAEGVQETEFLADLKGRDAAAMSLLVIGETARRLYDDTKARAPEIPWPAIISLHNRIAHGYETVDHQLVWQVLVDDLPALAGAVERLLASG